MEVVYLCERNVPYFAEYGRKNTGETLNVVKDRVDSTIKAVVVASTSGETGATFSAALRGLVPVVVVSHEEMRPSHKQKIRELGGDFVEKTHLPLHGEGMDGVRETFRTLGQGFKVAVEVILIAADTGRIPLHQDVIGVGGTGTGADTAIVARATRTDDVFSGDESKKLEIREVLAMPRQKKWW